MVYRVDVRHLSHFLQDVEPFQGLLQRYLDRIAALCEEWRFHAEDQLAVQGESGSRLYVIRSGEITVTSGFGEKNLVVRTVREREAFPVAVLFEPPLLVTTAVAATDGEALIIPRVGLMELCELEPRVGMHIYRAACAMLVSRYRYTLRMLGGVEGPLVQFGPSWKGGEV